MPSVAIFHLPSYHKTLLLNFAISSESQRWHLIGYMSKQIYRKSVNDLMEDRKIVNIRTQCDVQLHSSFSNSQLFL